MSKKKLNRSSQCPNCHKDFLQIENGTTYKYCSNECHQMARAPKKRETPFHDAECQLCSIIFQVKNRLTAKYCSDKCRSLARYRKLAGKLVKAPRERALYGDGYINVHGYRIIYCDHPNANKKTRCILEHIFIMSEHLGRPMRKGETVHHKNGIRHDNRIENLELWTSRHPAGVRYEDKISSAIDFLKEEGYKVVKE